jgi:predicted metal-dependent phosphoesterase TrpH
MHSSWSDGVHNEVEILKEIKEKGIRYFSLTDHDTIEGSKRILDHKDFLDENNIKFIIGAELSTSINGFKTHLLAYNFDSKSIHMDNLLNRIKDAQWKQTVYRIDKLNELFNIKLSSSSIEYLKSRFSVTKPNIAECMKNDGYVESKGQAIQEFINKIPKIDYYLSSEEAISCVHNASGKIFLAHPFGESSDEIFTIDNVEPYIWDLVQLGIDGMECFYSAYSFERINFLLDLAQKYNLLVSAGSDCHGRANKYGQIGQVSCDGTIPNSELITILNII